MGGGKRDGVRGIMDDVIIHSQNILEATNIFTFFQKLLERHMSSPWLRGSLGNVNICRHSGLKNLLVIGFYLIPIASFGRGWFGHATENRSSTKS